MKNKWKIVSVIACLMVIILCFIYYTGYVSDAVYYVRAFYPEAENCGARIIDSLPEGYSADDMDDDKLSEMDVVEITWRLSNIANECIEADNFWATYSTADGERLYAMEKDVEDSLIPAYENKKIIPPGKQVDYTAYVPVPQGTHEMVIRYTAMQRDDGMEEITVTF